MARPTKRKVLTDNRIRRMAVGMALNGVPFARIADACKVDRRTLTKWLGDDLEKARESTLGAAAGSVVQIALESEDEGKRLQAAQLLLKTQGGWTEEQRINMKWDGDFKKISTEQLLDLLTRFGDKAFGGDRAAMEAALAAEGLDPAKLLPAAETVVDVEAVPVSDEDSEDWKP